MTGFVPTMWLIWGVLALVVAGLKIYSNSLSQNEDDQIILDDAFSNLKTEQAAIVARVNKLAPFKVVSLWLFVAASVFVAGYYIMDIFNQFK
jgi:hypothetical protein